MATATTAHSVESPEQIHPPPINGVNQKWFSWLPSWKPTSEQCLMDAETVVLNTLKTEYTDYYVPIEENTFIRTISMSPETSSTNITSYPLVMVHGFGCGLAAFYKNLDFLHSKRQLYAFDVLGFGRSSRVPFTRDAERAEDEFVESFEKWRQACGLEKFILLGHSLGGFMSCSYAMKYPERVRHLILVDPWGFPEKPSEQEPTNRSGKYKIIYPAVESYVKLFNPFTFMRAVGPYGPNVLSRFRPDLVEKFGPDFMSYCYHCNAQNPSGETAFSYMQLPIAYSRRPLLNRLDALNPNVPMSMLYGTRSWFDNSVGEKVYAMRPNSYVDVHYIRGAGHHIHADLPEVFNEVVNDVCDMVDEGKDLLSEGEGRDEQTAFHSH